MQKLNSLQEVWRRSAAFFLTALIVVPADQLSKLWVKTNLSVGESLPETGFFRLTHIRNTGASFGLFQEHTFLLTIVSIIGASLVLFIVLFMPSRFQFLNTLPGRISLGLIFGGTIGNLIDRISSGYVTDFIAVSIWPPFNIADSATVVGSILLVYSLIRLAKKQ